MLRSIVQLYAEVVPRRSFKKTKVLLKILQNSQENSCAAVSFDKIAKGLHACNLIKK